MTTVVRPCSEFPNDNTALHAGAIFGLVDPIGPSVVIEPARPLPEPSRRPVAAVPAPEAAAGPADVDESSFSKPTPRERSAPGESGFFARAPEREADLELDDDLPDIVELGPLSTEEDSGFGRVVSILSRIGLELAGEAGPERVQAALLGRTQLPPPVAFALLHWRALLEGDDARAASLPDLTLDEWAAGFLGAVFALPSNELRSRVRAEGIAAFGLLDAA